VCSRAVSVDYVFRHFDAPAIAEQRSKVPLGGFGVELSLKSVEYKSFDDAAVKDAEGHSSQPTPTPAATMTAR
jgi:hypothetical protein